MGSLNVALDSFGLTLKQRLFCENYLSNGGNSRNAAKQAGYSTGAIDSIASETLSKPKVKEYIGKRVKEIADKVGLTTEYMLEKLRHGLDLSIPDREKMDYIAKQNLTLDEIVKVKSSIDVRAGVACISEANKMIGNYAPDKHAVLVEEDKTGKVTELLKEYEREF